MSVSTPIMPVAPVWPDYRICSYYYGSNINPDDCTAVVNGYLGEGYEIQRYYLAPPETDLAPRPDGYMQMPFSKRIRTCTLSIKIAGPRGYSDLSASEYLPVIPDFMRGLAAYLIQRCPSGNRGMGGYLTRGLGMVLDLMERARWELAARENFGPVAPPVNFLTIQVSNGKTERDNAEEHSSGVTNAASDVQADPAADPGTNNVVAPATPAIKGYGPGDTDPHVAEALEMHAADLYNNTISADDKDYYLRLSQAFHEQSLRMATPSRDITWWDNSLTIAPADPAHGVDETGTVDMSYDCDDKLGTPDRADCENLLFNKLGGLRFNRRNSAKEPTLIVGGGYPHQTHLGTCALSISASRITTITYDQLRAATESLTNYCISNPWKTAAGGRAHKGKEPISSWFGRYINWAPPVNGETVGTRRRLRRRAGEDVDGANALPANVEIVIMRHEPGKSLGCELQKARTGEDVKGC